MRKRVITYVVFAVCICAMSVLITYSIMQQKNNVTVGLYYGTFDFSKYQNVDSTKKLAIIHDNDEKQGEYEMEIEHTDKVETGTWSWNDDGYITLYQDNGILYMWMVNIFSLMPILKFKNLKGYLKRQ